MLAVHLSFPIDFFSIEVKKKNRLPHSFLITVAQNATLSRFSQTMKEMINGSRAA